ncbi:hypothetical protein ACHAWF_002607 [Thalassiosira exigua]
MRSEINKRGIQNHVGTPLLRGYIHGFFVHHEVYQSKKIKERMEEKLASWIVSKATAEKAKVNPDLAERLRAKAGGNTKAGKVAKALVEDDRFRGLFRNPDFAIDDEAEDFK